MAHVSVRCERARILAGKRHIQTSEVLEVMRKHDLMDILRVKCDGDLGQLTYMLTSTQVTAPNQNQCSEDGGIEEEKRSNSNLMHVGSDDILIQDRGSSNSSKGGSEVDRSNSSDPIVAPPMKFSYDEMDIAQPVALPGMVISSSGLSKLASNSDSSHGSIDERPSEGLKKGKKGSFLSRALFGLISSDSSHAEHENEMEVGNTTQIQHDIESGVEVGTSSAPSSELSSKGAAAPPSATSSSSRRNSTATTERELERKKSITSARNIAREAMAVANTKRQSLMSRLDTHKQAGQTADSQDADEDRVKHEGISTAKPPSSIPARERDSSIVGEEKTARQFGGHGQQPEKLQEKPIMRFYSYKELRRDPTTKELRDSFPSDVSTKHREQYLADAEFESIFNMKKSQFNSLPAWRQAELKKQHHLF